jgi:DNA-directed RNA polymerase subunit alpha
MPSIPLPQKPRLTLTDSASGRFEVSGCYPGYGTTLGNALRRVLLSSLQGAAVSSIKIRGIDHEFSTIPGVMEDVVQIILNVKKIRIKMEGEETVKVSLKYKGEGKVTAGEIKCPTGVEIVNADQLIATVTDKKTELEVEFEITKGLGYVPVEQQEKSEKEIGIIAIDSIYTPVRRVNYEVENMRVGKRTDYDKVTIEITTDGSITPEEAFLRAVNILVDHFSVLGSIEKEEKEKFEKETKAEEKILEEEKTDGAKGETDLLKMKISELKGLSTRTLNVLEVKKISKVKDIVKMSENDLKNLEGMGEKGIKEIKKAIGEYGLTLKQSS